jgi:hypothetical protein
MLILPATVKNAYGLIVPKRLFNPISISQIDIINIKTIDMISVMFWCLMFVYYTLFLRRTMNKTPKAMMAKKKEVDELKYVGLKDIIIENV